MRALGYPPSLIMEMVDPSPSRVVEVRARPLKYSTHLYNLCYIAKELHLTLEAYEKLPRKEKKTWYYFHILASKKDEFAHEESRREAEQRTPRRSASHVPKYRE